MILACLVIIGVLAAATGAMAVLYVLERKDTRTKPEDFRGEDTEERSLTPEGVADAVRCLGYVPVMQDDHVEFRISGQPYYIYTKDLPFMKLETKAIFENPIEESDYEFLIYATASVSENKQHLIEITPTGITDRNIQCCIAAFEPDRICFRESLIYYVNLIAETKREVCDCYNNLIDKKEFEESYLNWVDKDALSRKRPS